MVFSNFNNPIVFEVLGFACNLYQIDRFEFFKVAEYLRSIFKKHSDIQDSQIIQLLLEYDARLDQVENNECVTQSQSVNATKYDWFDEVGKDDELDVFDLIQLSLAEEAEPNVEPEIRKQRYKYEKRYKTELWKHQNEVYICERSEALENFGPLFEKILSIVLGFRNYDFIISVFRYWSRHSQITSRQMEAVVGIALCNGLFIDARLYAGRAKPEWVEPYFEAHQSADLAERKRKQKVKRDADKSQALWMKERKQAEEREQTEANKANKSVRVELSAMNRLGSLAEVDILMARVFPSMNRTEASKRAAFGGHGSYAMRNCLAFVAFGKPPSQVWQGTSAKPQSDEKSDHWLAIIGSSIDEPQQAPPPTDRHFQLDDLDDLVDPIDPIEFFFRSPISTNQPLDGALPANTDIRNTQ